MSHEITVADRFGYVGEKAWHGLGMEIPAGLSAAEGASLIGIDWKLGLKEIWMEGPNGERVPLEAWRAHTRLDTNAALAVVSKEYQTFQNSDLCELADLLRKADPSVYLETGGSLRGGKKVFLLMKLGEWQAGPGDTVFSYLCVVTSHDGTGATHAFYTKIRVVCANTLRWAMSGRSFRMGFRSNHYGKTVAARLAEAEKILGIAHKVEQRTQELVGLLRGTTLKTEAVSRYFEEVYERTFGGPPKAKLRSVTEEEQVRIGQAILEDALDGQHDPGKVLDEAVERYEKKRAERMGLWVANHDADVARGSAWGAFNAVTQFHDHQNSRTPDGDGRTNSVLFGTADKRKQIALDEILETVGVRTRK